MSNLAAVRIRGIVGVRHDIRQTLELLHLHKKNFCGVYKDTPTFRGMLTKAKDYITWGTVDEPTIRLLHEKRGEPYKGDPEKKGKFLTFDNKKFKPFFRLHPPRGGFEKKGIKTPYTLGGALGDRKADINRLVSQMV